MGDRGFRGDTRGPRRFTPSRDILASVNDLRFPLALSYDDVLLVPQRSDIASRRDIDTSCQFTRNVQLAVPIVSANMDTVTEADMAIAIARVGGIGVIHRFLTVAEQVRAVARVKRAEALVIEDPFTVPVTLTVGEAIAEMRLRSVSGLVVVGGDGRPVGIVTARDTRLQDDPSRSVREVMTPAERLVTAPVGISSDDAALRMRDARVEKLPLLGADGRLAGLITLRDLIQRSERPNATKDDRGRLAVAAAIGVRGDHLERAAALAEAGADALVLDIAHGHMDQALDAIGQVRDAAPGLDIVAGNVATAAGARDLIAAGADGVKVGVGPGSACTTRLVAGVGVPQLSAVIACAEVCNAAGVPLIADGGIRYGGDLAKAIGVGADTVMVGNLLAGTTESPGRVVSRNGSRVKVFRGMASAGAAESRRSIDTPDAPADDIDFSPVPEGVEAVVQLRGDAAGVVSDLVGGLRSGMSYTNARSIMEMKERAQFVRITPAGLVESRPHDVTM